MDFLFLILTLQHMFSPSTNYSQNNFVYYESQEVKPLGITNKVFIRLNKDSYLSFLYELPEIRFVEKVEDGYILTTSSAEETIDLLNKISKLFDNEILNLGEYNPIIVYENTEVLTTNLVEIKTKTFVTQNDLNEKLRRLFGKSVPLRKVDGNKYQVDFGGLKLPYNIFVIANSMANENGWVEHAIPVFIPIYGDIVIKGSITTTAHADLGHERYLNFEVNIYNSRIKFRDDLLPVGFRPYPYNGDEWFVMKPPTVVKIASSFKTTYYITYPFRHLHFGECFFYDLGFQYEENGVLKTYAVTPPSSRTIDYYIHSVIADTKIDDLQEIKLYETNINASGAKIDIDCLSSNKRLYDYLYYIGFIVCMVGLVVGLIPTVEVCKSMIGGWYEIYNRYNRETSGWRRLYFKGNLIEEKHWREGYSEMYNMLLELLDEYHNLKLPAAKEIITNSLLLDLLDELDKIYAKDVTPKLDVLRDTSMMLYHSRDRIGARSV